MPTTGIELTRSHTERSSNDLVLKLRGKGITAEIRLIGGNAEYAKLVEGKMYKLTISEI